MINKPEGITIYTRYDKVFKIVEDDIKKKYGHEINVSIGGDKDLKLFNSIHIITTSIIQPHSMESLFKRYFNYEGNDYLEVLDIVDKEIKKGEE